MLHELIDLFLESAPQQITRIAGSLEDPGKLAFHAHALKSMSLNLGARRMVEVSKSLEDLGRSGAMDTAPALIDELQKVFALTRARLLPLQDRKPG